MKNIPIQVTPPDIRGRERARARRVALTLGMVLLASLLLSPAGLDRLPPLCAMKALTGLPCPFCGLTHSVVALSHGHPATALSYHPFGPVLYIVGAVLLVFSLHTWLKGKSLLSRSSFGRPVRVAGYYLAAAWAAWWVLTCSLQLLR